MRLFFISFLVVLVSVSFTACGGGDSSSSTIGMSDNNRTTAGSDNDVVGNEVVLSPVGPFTAAGDFGVVKLSRDYPTAFKDALFIDIRNQWERDYLGYPKGSIDGIVYQYREHGGSGRETSDNKYKKRYIYKDFVQKVKAKVAGDINKKIILICASGSRSGSHKGEAKYKDKDSAAKLLSTNGFTNVYHVEGGFGDWEGADLEIVNPVK